MGKFDLVEIGLCVMSAFVVGVFVAGAIHLRENFRHNERVLDLEAQLQTCNDGREAIHHQLHIVSDSLYFLKHPK